MEGNVVRSRLYAVQFRREDGQGVINRVADEEAQIDEFVRVGEFGEEIEVLGDVRGGISERGEDEDALPVAEGAVGGDDRIEVDGLNTRGIDMIGLMVIKENGSLQVLIPRDIFVSAHVDGRFRRPKAVETVSLSAQVAHGSPTVRTLTFLL